MGSLQPGTSVDTQPKTGSVWPTLFD